MVGRSAISYQRPSQIGDRSCNARTDDMLLLIEEMSPEYNQLLVVRQFASRLTSRMNPQE